MEHGADVVLEHHSLNSIILNPGNVERKKDNTLKCGYFKKLQFVFLSNNITFNGSIIFNIKPPCFSDFLPISFLPVTFLIFSLLSLLDLSF